MYVYKCMFSVVYLLFVVNMINRLLVGIKKKLYRLVLISSPQKNAFILKLVFCKYYM